MPYYSIQTEPIQLVSSETEYPLVVTCVQTRVRVAEISISFDGNAAADDKILCSFIRVASASLGAAITPAAVSDEIAAAATTTALYEDNSDIGVGAVEKTTWAEYIHSQGGYTYKPGVTMKAGEVWALRTLSGSQAHKCVARIVVEE